jgi:hypothetical protein
MGEVSEWSKEHDWKSCMFLTGHRGFESLSLHQSSSRHSPKGNAGLRLGTASLRLGIARRATPDYAWRGQHRRY